jgi:hypothetical protein
LSEGNCIYLFETTHQAMWAEEVARESRIPAEIVAAPAGAKARCGLALQTMRASCEALSAAMESEGIEFRLYENASRRD